jgi:hypothetical protein
MRTRKPTNVAGKKMDRNLSAVVGGDAYTVWVRMLRKLVPDGRTHRLSVILAGMLHYAATMAAAAKQNKKEHSLAGSLI